MRPAVRLILAAVVVGAIVLPTISCHPDKRSHVYGPPYLLNQHFSPTTWMEFSGPAGEGLTVTLHNVLGQNLGIAYSGTFDAGGYRGFTLDTLYLMYSRGFGAVAVKTIPVSSLTSGVYLYRVTTSDTSYTKKIMLLK